jgi:hypothetical protein
MSFDAQAVRGQERHHSTVREGAIAGLLGAAGIAVWFFILDMAAGRPFYTPNLLGSSLATLFGPDISRDSMFMHVALYTVFHFAVFIAIGILAALLVHRAESNPSILAGVLILFVAFEIGFYGWTALLTERWGDFAWWQVMGANLIAAVLMGTYLWRRHPQLRSEFAFALGGGER